MENKIKRSDKRWLIRYDLLTFIWILVIMGLTFTPGPNIPPLPTWNLISFDTFVHAVIFAVLVFLMSNAFKSITTKNAFRKFPLLTSFFLSVGFGILIEIIQPYIPGRTFEYYDILSNTIGATIGALVVLIQNNFVSSDPSDR